MGEVSNAVQWVLLGRSVPVQVGDVVCTDAGGMPAYRVMALADDRALLRDDRDRDIDSLPLSRFHWKMAGASA